nr:transporter [Aeromicrobium sp.]
MLRPGGLRGAPQTLALGATVVAAGFLMRIVVHDSLWQVVVGATVIGMGTGIGYAAMPALINAHTPPSEIGAANGLNTLFRSLGSSLASAIGGSILAASTVIVGDFAVPSLGAYQQIFAVCGGAALLAAALVKLIPHQPSGHAA